MNQEAIIAEACKTSSLIHQKQNQYLQDKRIEIVGVAVNEGQDLLGTELGPKALREAGLAKVISSLGWKQNDLGDITNETIKIENTDASKYKYQDVKHAHILGGLCKQLHDTTKKSAEEKNFTLVLGGDHGLATGSISGLKAAYPDLKVIWIDAHADCNTPEASPSGNYHGMPVAHLLGWITEGSVPGFDWFTPNLKPEDIAYIGLRDIDEFEKNMKNPSKIPVKKLKMKVNPPRFLQIGHKEDLEVQFPASLERKSSRQSSLRSKTDKVSDDIFLFPEDTAIADGAPVSWPLWFRAAAPGKISLYLSVYYEMGDISSVMTYRTLRLHFDIEVLPSLDMSLQISPRPSRLREFLVRMDVVNRSSSKGFQVHQLSSVGNEWEISLLEPTKVLPSDFLLAGQAISWFLKLKNCRSVTDKDSASSLCPPEKADINLLSGSEMLFDLYSSPFSEFHHYERVHQRMSDKEHDDTVDFILVSRSPSEENKCENVFSHHMCHNSVRTSSPIWWIMDGPRTVKHDFKEPFCAITLRMIVHNSSDDIVSVRCIPSDSAVSISSSGNASASSGNEVGWHDLSLTNDIKITSDTSGARAVKPMSSDTVPPFIWSASSSTHFTLDPLSSRETPMEICVFSTGTFDLSNYSLHWSISSPSDKRKNGDESRASSGTCQGHPFYITLLQQD